MISGKPARRMAWCWVVMVCICLTSSGVRADCISDWLADNPPVGTISTQEINDIDCVFNWFEDTFTQAYSPSAITYNFGSLAYRFYTVENSFLLAWKTSSLKIAYLGSLTGNCIMDLGTVNYWKSLVCQGKAGVTPGLWKGSNIQFFVSADGKSLTTTGSSILYNGTYYFMKLGPTTFTNVGICSSATLTAYIKGNDLPITNNSFSMQTNDGSFKASGTFSSPMASSGTFDMNSYISDCMASVTGTRSWTASPSTSSISSQNGSTDVQEIHVDDDILLVIERN